MCGLQGRCFVSTPETKQNTLVCWISSSVGTDFSACRASGFLVGSVFTKSDSFVPKLWGGWCSKVLWKHDVDPKTLTCGKLKWLDRKIIPTDTRRSNQATRCYHLGGNKQCFSCGSQNDRRPARLPGDTNRDQHETDAWNHFSSSFGLLQVMFYV